MVTRIGAMGPPPPPAAPSVPRSASEEFSCRNTASLRPQRTPAQAFLFWKELRHLGMSPASGWCRLRAIGSARQRWGWGRLGRYPWRPGSFLCMVGVEMAHRARDCHRMCRRWEGQCRRAVNAHQRAGGGALISGQLLLMEGSTGQELGLG